MRKTRTYFEQVPVEKVKEILVHLPENQELRPAVAHSLHNLLRCAICSQPVPVETAKTDGYGKAIHEECFLASLRGKAVVSGTRGTPLV